MVERISSFHFFGWSNQWFKNRRIQCNWPVAFGAVQSKFCKLHQRQLASQCWLWKLRWCWLWERLWYRLRLRSRQDCLLCLQQSRVWTGFRFQRLRKTQPNETTCFSFLQLAACFSDSFVGGLDPTPEMVRLPLAAMPCRDSNEQ